MTEPQIHEARLTEQRGKRHNSRVRVEDFSTPLKLRLNKEVESH